MGDISLLTVSYGIHSIPHPGVRAICVALSEASQSKLQQLRCSMPQQETEQGEINEGVVNGKLVRSAGRLSDLVTVSQVCERGFNAKVSKVRNTARFVHEAAESSTESVLTGGPRAESRAASACTCSKMSILGRG